MRYDCSLYSIIMVYKVISWPTLCIIYTAQILSGMMLLTKWVASSLGHNYLGQHE